MRTIGLVSSVLTAALCFAAASASAGGKMTQKKNGVTVTVESDGKNGNDGSSLSSFEVIAESSKRQGDMIVRGTIELTGGGEELSTCDFELQVAALAKTATIATCAEDREWDSFSFRIDSVAAAAKGGE
jgi:hypothetical protein